MKESATLANTPSFNIIGTASSVDAIPLFSIIGAQDLPSMPHVEVIDQQTAQDPVTPRSTTFSMIGGMHGAALRTTPLLFTMLK